VYAKNRSISMSLYSKIYLLLNVVHGIRHLINYNIVHLDLKPENILVNKFMITKLIDFG
jgi:serine/threonine protein kinase